MSARPLKMIQQKAYRIYINGIVQGVGFRPFVYNLAIHYALNGWVRNTSGGVEIEVTGPEDQLEQFLVSLENDTPPLAQVDSLRFETIPFDGHKTFEILQSRADAVGFQPISPDVSICDDCLEELFSPADRRYRYPFINCTNCGPRFTIIKDIPYDRPKTTMVDFGLCQPCKEEYENPRDRRFHAQPVACPQCGPHVWLEYANQTGKKPTAVEDDAILEIQRLITEGKIAAVKGLGGFHLACDAENSSAVGRLRKRKDRPSKPLAVMMPDLKTIHKHCLLSAAEKKLLSSPQRPILLLNKRPGSKLPDILAPGQETLGVMLPYTPLHYLLFSTNDKYPKAPFSVLVMTSANISGNPILSHNQPVREQLNSIADAYLFHNRDIHIHCDDTVTRIPPLYTDETSFSYPVRRSRGFSPFPLRLPKKSPPVLGVGGELKNTFCLTKEDYAFLSQHIGDLKNFETLTSYEVSITHIENLFRIEPEMIIYDMHPDYLSTRYAINRSTHSAVPAIPVQHHHAHITSCLADNLYHGEEPVIGIAFDGIGYGEDDLIWGGEFLIADYQGYTRAGQLKYFPLPGGDTAIREPWRMALSALHSCELPWEEHYPPVKYAASLSAKVPDLSLLGVLKNQLNTRINTPLTSSIGRLFDAVASLIGICHSITYEGQAAIELEAIADPNEQGIYPFIITPENIFDPGPMLKVILEEITQQVRGSTISARFHNSLAEMVLHMATRLRDEYHLNQVALSGGVWQNMTLLTKSVPKLEAADFQVFLHQRVPPNDGGLALGQVVIGQRTLMG